MQRLLATIILLVLLLTSISAFADEPIRKKPPGKSISRKLLFYIPNRIFDIFDIARARLRVGPGFAVDARATKYGDFYAGTYGSLFVGIHGPRLKPRIPLPIGVESRTGIKATSVADLATRGPTYGYGEVGTGFQAGLVGMDVGVDVVEIADLILGFFFIDLTGDDF